MAIAPRALPARARVAPGRDALPLVEAEAHALGLGPLDDGDRALVEALLTGSDTWSSAGDGIRARRRVFAAVRALGGPLLMVGASVATLATERDFLKGVGLPAILLEVSEGRLPRAAHDAARAGGAVVFLASSEALWDETLLAFLDKARIVAACVDAADLASELGHELRPSFKNLSALRERLGDFPMHGLGRLGSREVHGDAMRQLGLKAPIVIEAPLVGDSVRLETCSVRADRRNTLLVEALLELPRPGVVLCATPHEVDAVFALLSGAGLACNRVHSGMPAADRQAAQAKFEGGAASVLVTTSALGPDTGLVGLGETVTTEARVGFGLRGTRPDLKFIVHHQAPASLEQYARELSFLSNHSDATALLFFDSSHTSVNQAILEQLRFSGPKLEELGRALAAATPGSKALTLEALALHTGQSRRTTDRMIALLVDAGLLQRSPSGLCASRSPEELSAGAASVALRLEAMRRGDAARLKAVERYAEASECKARLFRRYFGVVDRGDCGRCSACRGPAKPAPRLASPARGGRPG